ncbi:MAG: hypothetical protein HOE69_07655 [Euryarchaeota archaeon]|jgi:hypothetical protein|nr:hypothetical protein [Euryarchaeota archaeon]
MRLVFVARNQALRLGSAVTRGADFADEVIVISLGEDDEQKKMVEDAGGIFVIHEGEPHAPDLARTLEKLNLPESENTVAIGLDKDWKLKSLPRHIALSRSRHDIYIAFKHRSDNLRIKQIPDEKQAITIASYSYQDAAISVCAFTPKGLSALALADVVDKPADLPKELSVRIIELDAAPVRKELESLTSASRFAQLFYWMLESKHPLIVLGIPGIIFFTVGYQMASALIDVGGPHDTVSIGVALTAFAVTFIGVLSLVSGLVLYILGKQIDKVQLGYQ